MSHTAWMRVVRNELGRYIRSEPELSRRDFVSLTAKLLGAGIVATHSFPFQALSSEKKIKPSSVLVIGGGVSGLTTAYRLASEGIRVKLFEAQDRLGGRIYTQFNVNKDSQFIELGAELIDSNHTDILSLAQELGLKIDDFRNEDTGLTKMTLFFEGKSHSAQDFQRDAKPLFDRIIHDYDLIEKNPAHIQTLDQLSLKEYLDSIATLPTWVSTFIRVAFEGEYGLASRELSPMGLITLLGSNPSSGSPFGNSDECMRIQGGNSKLILALEKKCKELGVEIFLSTKLESITSEPDNALKLSFQHQTFITKDPVVLTLPLSILRSIKGIQTLPLTPPTRKAILELGMGMNSKSMMEFKTKFWRTKHHQSGSLFSDQTLDCMWETSRGQPGSTGILTQFISRGDQPMDLAEIPDALEKLEPASPGLQSQFTKRLGAFHWPTFKYALGSYSCPKKGQWNTLLAAFEKPSYGVNLYFAGEHCSKEFFGFMNGAVESAHRAAREIILSRFSVVESQSKYSET